MNFKVYVLAEIICIALFVWFGFGLLRIMGFEEEPVVSNTINFSGADTDNQNSFLTVDVAQNDKFVKLQVTQGSPTATLCPQGDTDPADCAQADTDPTDLRGIDATGATIWKVDQGTYTLVISDNQNEPVTYNLLVIHQPGMNTIIRDSLSTLVFGIASVICGSIVLKGIKKRRSEGL